MARAETLQRATPPVRRRVDRHDAEPPRIHLGRLLLLALLLIAAAFYVPPLKAFFAQQDRYQRSEVALKEARAENEAMKLEVSLLNSREYIAQRAREDSMLVPANTQVFVIKGLPQDKPNPDAGLKAPAKLSVVERLGDLWHTLRN